MYGLLVIMMTGLMTMVYSFSVDGTKKTIRKGGFRDPAGDLTFPVMKCLMQVPERSSRRQERDLIGLYGLFLEELTMILRNDIYSRQISVSMVHPDLLPVINGEYSRPFQLDGESRKSRFGNPFGINSLNSNFGHPGGSWAIKILEHIRLMPLSI